MKNNTSNIIAGYAWDCTVGAGSDREPRAQDVAQLTKLLGRELTAGEVKLFHSKWSECLQSMAQP
jgi:hypothetical protein